MDPVSRAKTVPAFQASKRRNGAEPIVMVTAYDAPGARVASEADVDIILVGDSVGMVVLGHTDTMQVTIADMVHHVKAVANAKPDCLILADMPWMSFHVSTEDTVRNAAELIRAGAQCVKMEGGRKRLPMLRALIDAEIPVMSHIGLTPQSFNMMGGFKVQGREKEAVDELIDEARAMEAGGAFSVLIEGVPDVVGSMVTEALTIPTIGIGAGLDCDGQVLVYHDVIGLENRFKPKFVRRFGAAYDDQVAAIGQYTKEVREGTFPTEAETYRANDNLRDALGLYGSEVPEA